MVKISLCLLTENNENSLKRCFYPIKESLHEILAIDLGSTDNTLKILQEYGGRIIEFKFEDDFSAAKNRLIEEASGEFILFLDPDEVIFKDDMQKLAKYLKENPNDEAMAYMFYVRNYTNTTSTRGFKPSRIYGFEGYFTSEQARLIRNNKEIKFSFAVDETLMPSLDKIKAVVKHIVDIPIHNYCYKSRIKILEKLANNSSDIRIWYNTAISNLNTGNTSEAKKFFQKVVDEIPSYKKALFNLGAIYMAENKLDTATKLFQKSLEFDDKNTGAYYNLGLIFHKTKQFEKAEIFLKKALSLEPEDFRIYRGLSLLYINMGDKEMAKKALNSALHYNPKDSGLIALKKSLL